MSDRPRTGVAGSWRRALAPGESHGFAATPGWWDLRDIVRDQDDVPAARAALLHALPPLPDGSAVLDLGGGTGTLLARLAVYYPRLRYTLLDANPAALARAEAKLRAVVPDIDLTLLAEPVAPLAPEPLPGGPYQLVTSSIAMHDIARPAAPDDAAGRERHFAEHQVAAAARARGVGAGRASGLRRRDAPPVSGGGASGAAGGRRV